MAERYMKMVRRVGKGFYAENISSVRNAVNGGTVTNLIRDTEKARTDLVTVGFRIRAMASAVRQGYDR